MTKVESMMGTKAFTAPTRQEAEAEAQAWINSLRRPLKNPRSQSFSADEIKGSLVGKGKWTAVVHYDE
jgi:hypothetical protein